MVKVTNITNSGQSIDTKKCLDIIKDEIYKRDYKYQNMDVTIAEIIHAVETYLSHYPEMSQLTKKQ